MAGQNRWAKQAAAGRLTTNSSARGPGALPGLKMANSGPEVRQASPASSQISFFFDFSLEVYLSKESQTVRLILCQGQISRELLLRSDGIAEGCLG
jgi:hypothetical protein